MKVTSLHSLVRSVISLVLFATCTFFSTHAQNHHHHSQASQQKSLGTGRYVGRAFNTTSGLPIVGRVVFQVTEFEKVSGQVKVAMHFSEGLCGKGSFSGIVDDEGVSLSGTLATNDAICGEQSWKMVTRCKFKGSEMLTCSYRLSHESNTSDNQKGTFEVTRASTQQATGPIQTDRPRSTSRPKRRVEFPKEDPGVDLAVVIVLKANLRDGPSTSNAIVMEIEQDDVLVLVDRVPVGPWYNVVHVESSNEGWINGNAIEVKYTQKRQTGPLLEERSTGGNQNPFIEVTNDSDKILYLKIGDSRYTINPHASKTVALVPGTYKYYASSPGIIPAFGEDNLRAGYIYTWKFYIVTVPGE